MGFVKCLEELSSTKNQNIARQIVYMLEQLNDESSVLYPSDREDAEEAESEEDISYYADGDHNEMVMEKSAVEDFIKQLSLNKEDVMQQSITEKVDEELIEERNSQLLFPNDSDNFAESRIPSAMRARPKIPRTPIPTQKLDQVKKENQEILKNAIYIQKNPQSNKKKQMEKVKGEEPQYLMQEDVRKKMIRSEAKSRTAEEHKLGKNTIKKKEAENSKASIKN